MKKFLSAALVISLLLSMTVLFTSCGGPTTLEEYINSNSEAQETLDSIAAGSNMDIDVSKNTITYTYKYAQTYDASVLPTMKSAMESTMTEMSSTFENLAGTLEEESEIDGITVCVKYLNGDGSEIYSANYTSK